MFPEHDPYWTEVRDFILSAADTNAVLMAPTEFLEYFPNAYHYHVDTILPLDQYDYIVLHKGMLDQLAPGSLESIIRSYSQVFVNPVFVIYAKSRVQGHRTRGALLREARIVDKVLVRKVLADRCKSLVLLPRGRHRGSTTACVVCAYNRPDMLRPCLADVLALGVPTLVVVDGQETGAQRECAEIAQHAGTASLVLPCNRGLCCALNAGVSYWLADPSVEWISVFQDDCRVRRETLEMCNRVGDPRERPLVTGHFANEHPVAGRARVAGIEVIMQPSVSGPHFHAHRDYWAGVMPIPTPYLGAPKSNQPRPGQGSDEDWWISAWAPQSVLKQGRYVICVPGLVEHMGGSRSASSTWGPT